MRRKLAILALAALAGGLLALALLPWWLGVALDVAGRRFGLTFGEYQRIGYARFALHEVEVRRPGVQIKASRIELGTPVAWLVRRQGEVSIGQWSVIATPPSPAPKPERPGGWNPLRARLDPIITLLERSLPPATAGAGEIAWPGGKLHLASADWREHRLHVAGLAWRNQIADVTITRNGERWGGEVRTPDDRADVRLIAEGARIKVQGRWWGEPFSAQATFAETGWMPTEATAEARDWTLAADRLGLGGFYETVAGGALLAWRDGKFTVEVQAEGKPLTGTDAPPLHVQLQGSGGFDQFSVNRLDVRMPGVAGHLNEPVVIGRDGRLLSAASRLDLVVDLAKQPWIPGRGRITGSVEVMPQSEGVPVVSATLSAADASVLDWVAKKAVVDAKLQWPLLSVTTAMVKLADGDELTLGGEWNVRTRTLAQGRVKGRISRATVARWLTSRGDFENFMVDVTASGTWPAIAHEGRAQVLGLDMPPLRPLALDLAWKGSGRGLESVAVNAVAKDTRLFARGAVSADSARLDELVLAQTGSERLRLAAPAHVQWKPSVEVGEFRLKGPTSDVAGKLKWGESGEAKVDVAGFESAWLNDLVALPGPAWSVTSLAAQGAWDHGPLTFTAKGAGVVTIAGDRKGEVAFSARGNPQGVQLESVRGSMDQQLVARATGTLPVTVYPGQKPLVRIEETAPLSLDATTEPNAVFWQQVGALTGLAITDPSVRVTLAGTVRKPVGEADVRIARIAFEGKGRLRTLPEIEGLDARLTADRAGVSLDVFTFKAAGQAVRVSGRLPVNQWASLAEDPLSLAKADGEARLEIPNADVAALSRYAPAYLAPTGTLKVDVALKPGGQVQGGIWLKDAATRPLGPLGILQSVGAEILLNGRTVELKQVSAMSGGQVVALTGTVALPEDKMPRLDLALRGEKLPFVRQAGLLVRGDLDLRIVTGDDEVTRITGATTLRDSLFLMDVRAFLPTGGPRNAPGRRPPYFSVDVPPFDEWPLDITVDGDKFLRLRTPVFNGVTSAHFRLQGTLGDPRATGEALVDQGQVILPFATFAVRQGDVRLTEANPFEPRISLVGTSRRFGYDLRMEVTGTVEKPILTFSSTPPLESEQVLLMVMAGETPQNEVTYSSRQRAARLGAFLGRSLLGQLGPDPTAAERLSITTGERVSRQGRETYSAEYMLNPRWSVVGEYDEFDDYNLGVKWRVLSEKRRQEEKKDGPK